MIYDEETETASLVIKNVNLDDSGEYVVIAENEISMDKQTLSLSIKGNTINIKNILPIFSSDFDVGICVYNFPFSIIT